MFFPRRLSLRRVAPVKPRKRARLRGRRDTAFVPGPEYCGTTAEELERRQMLAAATLANIGSAVPTFMIKPGTHPLAVPATQPGTRSLHAAAGGNGLRRES